MSNLKDLFPWKYKPTKTELDALWKNAIFVFDSNFLLDFYRMGLPTAKEILKALELQNNRVWIIVQDKT
jgi:hypothetical protein